MKANYPFLKTTSLILTGIIVGVLASILLFNIFHVASGPAPSDHQALMQSCLDKVIQKVSPSRVSAGLYERFWRLCGNQIFNGLYLEDFVIRREKFIRQEFDERVNLWLVVIITISGVALAAVQLFLSYKLAVRGQTEFAKDSELAVEAGKISLRSSITGAIILALSLLFFIVYVIYIYSVREISYQPPGNLQPPLEDQNMDQNRTSPASLDSSSTTRPPQSTPSKAQ